MRSRINIKDIGEGWLNLARKEMGIGDDRVEKLAKVRGEICLSCEKLNRKTLVCTDCGCVMPAKIRVKDKHCPLNKW